ncbi:hypothetical protein D3C87_1796830 [compost metagenome]
MAARPSGKTRPVASWRFLPQWPSRMMATMASPSPASIQSSELPSSAGTFRPRLEMKTPGSGLWAWRGPGMFSVISAYQKNSCSSSGTLRITST